MIVGIADNIFSPLGHSSQENFEAVRQGKSRLCEYTQGHRLPEPFVASLFEGDDRKTMPGLTLFETIVVKSVERALAQTNVDTTSPRTLFVISSTKGNIDLLDEVPEGISRDRVLLGKAADVIARHFHSPNRPVVVSNACISGLSAQIAAIRMLRSGYYDTAIVVGAEVQSRFIVSGFQSFKALSPMACKPFDAERLGLNLGEAAATVIYQTVEEAGPDAWIPLAGSVRNDAFHISGPSRTAEGSFRALHDVVQGQDIDQIAFINAHGTSTLYNDEMEAFAIDRASLAQIPVNSFKGYYGHTMGAAGILETIISMKSVDNGLILATKGFESPGITHSLDVVAANRTTRKRGFVKLLSGFGGCNAAMMFMKGGDQ